jgi:hypothetical protein
MFGINVSEHNPQLEIFLEKIKKVEDKISSLTIISVEDSLSAVEIRKEALSIKKEIEETRV